MSESKYQCKNVVASGHTTANLSRLSLLKWVNDLLGTKIQKVEALCSGALYCQIFNMLFPGCIPMKKVKLEATQTHDFWINFKQLQIGFRAVGCEKEVLIDTLIKGRFQDNFEFLQWFKRFYDANVDSAACASKPASNQPTSSKAKTRNIFTLTPKYTPVEREMKIRYELAEHRRKAIKVQEEKDFYFTKLRNIELMCTAEDAANTELKVMVKKILTELYETAEGFEPPEVHEEEGAEEDPEEELGEDEPGED